MNYQVSTVECTIPAFEGDAPKDYSLPEEKITATVINVMGNINLDNIILPREHNSKVYIKNNKNQWVYMHINEDGSAYCVDNMLDVYWYDINDKSKCSENWDEQSYMGAPEYLRQLYYLKAELN